MFPFLWHQILLPCCNIDNIATIVIQIIILVVFIRMQILNAENNSKKTLQTYKKTEDDMEDMLRLELN